jgi:SAM-dependent methyltransferase
LLDYGCGYGRVLQILRDEGFDHLAGIDISMAMTVRARSAVRDVPFAVCGGDAAPFCDASFDAVLLFAVLTSIPCDEDQRKLMAEMRRLLVPGGVVYVSDFLMHSDARNRERYRADAARFGKLGVFEIEGDAVMRHHSMDWIRELMETFEPVEVSEFAATTMHGNPAAGFRYLARAPGRR